MSIPPPYQSGPPPSAGDDRAFAILAYLLGVPTAFIAPLIIWVLRKDQSRFVAFHSLQSAIFQAVIKIAYIIAYSTCLLVWLMPIIFIVELIFVILATAAANRGTYYEIPIIGALVQGLVK